ncbi:hypothetical protein [Microbacterium thalassium]|uniref:Succinate dehydrogenase hydrophobic anchor subunit n=1 Tax=Microbacterium thalassium TaxID=362649 RepID=A0A7X0KUW8_9MICO|nr:hypothetical protein [Microbacterium thalassium]MBB6391607.1 succinate dehydrogenase hydrophobic anchor subunit [Microbacterium thalassium]GLK24210.1 hypothetical protein GCM10017607_15280 [Microbacterium thalassium]
MTADPALFVAIAEIAGVFVGFAALISATGRDEITSAQLAQVRAVVTIGLVVIVAALVPVGLSAYGLADAVVWRVSAAVFLVLVWAVIALALRLRENRAAARAQARSRPALAAVFWGVLEVAIQLPLVLTIIGVFPDQAEALYTTALLVHLFEAAFVLGEFVYARMLRRPATALTPDEQE